jgi:hypothetical protein
MQNSSPYRQKAIAKQEAAEEEIRRYIHEQDGFDSEGRF